MSRPNPKVTFIHHDYKEPEYDLTALETDLVRSKRHAQILRDEVSKQETYQENLKRLIKIAKAKR